MRIVLLIAALISALFFPAWITIFVIIGVIVHHAAWEMLFVALMLDFIWVPASSAWHILPFFTVITLIALWGIEPVRGEIL